MKLQVIGRVYQVFGPHLKTYRRYFLLAYSALFAAVLVGLLKPWPLKLIFDYILLEQPMPAGLAEWAAWIGADQATLLAIFSLSIVLVFSAEGLFSYLRKYYMASAGESAINDIRQVVFRHLQTLSQGTGRTGDLVVRLTSDIRAMKNLLTRHVQTFVTYLFTFVCITLTMLWMNWKLTVIALVVVPLLGLLAFYFSGKVERLAKEKRAQESEIASIVQEAMTTRTLTQAFSQEEQEKRRFAKESDKSLQASLGKLRMAKVFGRAVRGMIAVGTALVVWYGAQQALVGEVSPGDLIVFTAYLRDLYKPVGGFAQLLINFTSSLVSGERVAELLELKAQVKDAPGAMEAPTLRGAVVFDRVDFGYNRTEPVLQQLSFTVQPGETVALVGSSGTGKSTVVNLLLRFYDPWSGRILIDGEDLRHYRIQSLRQQMSVVLQESLLLHRTVRENIAYGKPAAKEEEVIAAAQAAQAHDFIRQLPDGYETLVGERGETLSGGQRQRIALARALLMAAPILILDEPVSGLDAITEKQVHETLQQLMQGRTSFVIAHRLDTIKNADLILLIEEGKVIEQGRHAELLANSGLYRRLYRLQQQEVLELQEEGL